MLSKILSVALLMGVITACNSNKSAVSKLEEQNVIIAKQLVEYFNKHDWKNMAALYTDTADFKDPSFGQGIVTQTRQQTIEKYTKLQEMSADIKDEITHVYPSGDKYVILEFTSSGTLANGTKWTLPICDIFTIENGKITKDFTYYDKE